MKIALITGLITSLIEVFTMVYFKNSLFNIFLFIFINFILKIVPILILIKSEYKIIDVYAFVGLFIIYLVWLLINHVNIRKELTNVIIRIQQNKPIGPIMYYVNKI
jgi:hypothetical protein